MIAHGMAVQALAGEIVEAARRDAGHIDSYDIAAGRFGPAMTDLLRRLAADALASASIAAIHRDALNDIQARVASGYFVDAEHLGDIARAALKEPTP